MSHLHMVAELLTFLLLKTVDFLDLLHPFDEVMADRGFKIKEELMMRMATLCVPPSKAASMQMIPADVKQSSNIPNVRIYVEQAIGRMKVFSILKHELPISLLSEAELFVFVVLCAICYHLCVYEITYRTCLLACFLPLGASNSNKCSTQRRKKCYGWLFKAMLALTKDILKFTPLF